MEFVEVTVASRAHRARRSSPPGCRSRFAGSSSWRWGTCSRPSRCAGTSWSSLPLLVAEPVAGAGGRCRACRSGRSAGSGGRSCRASRSRGRWRRSGRRGSRSSRGARPRSAACRAASSLAVSFQLKSCGRMRVFRGVVAQRVEQRVGHVGLEAERLRAADQFQKLDHPPPTVHAAPADFALGGQPLAVILGDVAGLAECVGDPAACSPRDRLSPVAGAAGRVDPHDAVGPDAQLAQLSWRCGSPCGPARGTSCAPSSLPIAEPPPVGGQTGATTEPITRFRCAGLVGQPLQIVVRRVDVDVRGEEEQIERRRTSRRRPRPRPSGRASCPGRSAARSRALCRPRPARRRCEAWDKLLACGI